MTVGSAQHIILFLATAVFAILSSLAVAKMPRKWQNTMIAIAAFVSVSAIFYRYAMGLSWEGGIDVQSLLIQQLQVCNFNFILLPLMLVPKFKLVRQYGFFFSMFAASTTLVALSSSWAGLPWYTPTVLNSWIYHSFAIICPLWMFATGGLRPERKYVLPVSGCVFGYFTLVYGICEILKGEGIIAAEQSFSYIYNADGIPLLSIFYNWIGLPYFHLVPSFILAIAFFYLLSIPFTRSVSFNGNGGSGRIKRIYGTVGVELELPASGFSKDGCKLVGWSDSPDGRIKYSLAEKIRIGKKNIQLYAAWSTHDGKSDN